MHETIWGILCGPYGVCFFRCGSLSVHTSLQLIISGAVCSDLLLFFCVGVGIRIRFALTAVRFGLTAVRFGLTAVRFVGIRVRFVGILSCSLLFFRVLWRLAASKFWLLRDEGRTAPFFRDL